MWEVLDIRMYKAGGIVGGTRWFGSGSRDHQPANCHGDGAVVDGFKIGEAHLEDRN